MRAINRRHGKQVVVVAPVGRAVIALREKVRRGEIPLVAKQADLFTDEGNHPGALVQALAAYCTHAVIYGENPVGLPALQIISGWGKGTIAQREALNAELQRIAWQAVMEHPLAVVW